MQELESIKLSRVSQTTACRPSPSPTTCGAENNRPEGIQMVPCPFMSRSRRSADGLGTSANDHSCGENFRGSQFKHLYDGRQAVVWLTRESFMDSNSCIVVA